MPDDSFGDKTEVPTPRRLEEARERGQVPRSVDLTSALVLLAGVGILYLAGGRLSRSLLGAMEEMLGCGEVGTLSSQAVLGDFAKSTWHFGLAVAPIMLGIALVAVLANLIQSGPVFTTHPLQPSLEKLNPATGFGRIFSKRALARLVGNLLKLGTIAWISYVAILGDYEKIIGLPQMGVAEMARSSGYLICSLGFKLAGILLVVALFDYMYQRWQYREDLKMTRQEVREEMKRMEGDPLIREQRRHIQRQMAMHRMSAEVPRADAVITNPTHFAIAIRYDTGEMAAPKVVAKGADLLARRIREIAIENGVPIVEKPALARTLYKAVEVGQEIPMQFYQAVAEVLAFVYRISNRDFAPTAL
ncbi:MAG: flagellar biosynthesis protein FlhB [Anaerolineaceae bacterium]|nr:flagellar biosynthesis protein FlhB [Anaerolineaceae bacterium]